LTRNIVVRGDDNSTKQNFGAHSNAAHGGTYRVENSKFTHCGQEGLLGRYCLHMHMAGDMSHSYIKSNSIHHSFQRATTIHGTHGTVVSNNVAYHVLGHTYFVEDGGEMFNVFEGNLGVGTIRSAVGITSDLKPATFWMSSPKNSWRNNIAAGSDGQGYWFELPASPGGASASADNTFCSNSEHLVQFFNNSAHSNGMNCLCVYPRWTPVADSCNASSGPAPQYLENFTSWRNGLGLFHKKAGDIHHIDTI
jgi:hypothetical protein